MSYQSGFTQDSELATHAQTQSEASMQAYHNATRHWVAISCTPDARWLSDPSMQQQHTTAYMWLKYVP